jgi:aldehyde dehydrogenase (NAD+)
MDPKAVAFVNGGVKETTVLLENQFDHILYTGNGTVGRIVMGAAAKHLTPVVLELGGKSPVIIDPSMAEKDMELVGRRVSWGRFANAGQTCIAPDYAMVPKRLLPAFVASVKKAIGEFYGPDPMNSGDLARVINATHTKRIGALIDEEKAAGSKIEAGGQWDAEKCRVAPTVVVTTFDGALMRGEIFGPVLPVIAVETVDEMIEHVNVGDRPLALCEFRVVKFFPVLSNPFPPDAFTHDTKLATRIHSEAISGGVTINEVMLHAAADSAPFGGVGASGSEFLGAFSS